MIVSFLNKLFTEKKLKIEIDFDLMQDIKFYKRLRVEWILYAKEIYPIFFFYQKSWCKYYHEFNNNEENKWCKCSKLKIFNKFSIEIA